MKDILIVSGGRIQKDFALAFIKDLKADAVIGVDRGLEFLLEAGIRPDLIVGDFDSVSPEVLDAYLKDSTIPFQRYNPVKDDTDTAIALEKALELIDEKDGKIWILGATGSRLDHVLGNIGILWQALAAGHQAFLLDANNRISLVEKERRLRKEDQFGDYISLIPLGYEVEGLDIKGVKYPLDGINLSRFTSLGVSNEITEEEARIRLTKGILIMIESRD